VTPAGASSGRPAPPPPVCQVELLAPPLRPEFHRPLSGWSVSLRLKIPSMKARRSMAGIPTFSSCGRQATQYCYKNDQVACRRRFGCWGHPLDGQSLRLRLVTSLARRLVGATSGVPAQGAARSGTAVRSEVVAARRRELRTGILAAVVSRVDLEEESARARRLRRLGGTGSPRGWLALAHPITVARLKPLGLADQGGAQRGMAVPHRHPASTTRGTSATTPAGTSSEGQPHHGPFTVQKWLALLGRQTDPVASPVGNCSLIQIRSQPRSNSNGRPARWPPPPGAAH
jgi:hypothetical protein